MYVRGTVQDEHSGFDKMKAVFSLRPRSCRSVGRDNWSWSSSSGARDCTCSPSWYRPMCNSPKSAGPDDSSVTFNRVKMRLDVVFVEMSRIASTFFQRFVPGLVWLVLVQAVVLGSRSFNGIACAVQTDWEYAAL